MTLTERLNQFIADIQGQLIEVSDASNVYQCMDLAFLWVIALGIPKSTIQHLFAYQVYTNPNPNTTQYFDLIPNTATFIPQDGDIAVFDKTLGNIAGHIGIALGGGNINTFLLFNQNSPLGTSAHIATYNYNTPRLLGVLRPKNTNPQPIPGPITSQTKVPASLLNTPEYPVVNDMEVQAIKSELQGQSKKISVLQNKLNQVKQIVN